VLEKMKIQIRGISARVARFRELILKEGLPDQVLLNVNVPEPWNAA